MEQISPKDRRSLIHPSPLGYKLRVPKVDSTSGKLFAGEYEPLDQAKLDSKIYELDACLKNGFDLEPAEPIDYSNFDQRLSYVESSLAKLSSVKSSVKSDVKPTNPE